MFVGGDGRFVGLMSAPGMVDSTLALSVGDTKQQALATFCKTDVNYLPVIDKNGKLAGVVNRGKLNSELLVSILEAAQGS